MSYAICRRCNRIVPRLSTWPAVVTCPECVEAWKSEREAQGGDDAR